MSSSRSNSTILLPQPQDLSVSTKDAGASRCGSDIERAEMKVAWVPTPPSLSVPLRSPRGLDAEGRDPEGFQTLRTALESSSSVTSLHPRHTISNSISSLNSAVSADGAITPPTYDVPGANYIDRNERAGLPGRSIEREHTKRMTYILSSRAQPSLRTFGSHRSQETCTPTRSQTKDDVQRMVEFGMLMDPEPVVESKEKSAPQTGMLSTLLQYYDTKRNEESLPADSHGHHAALMMAGDWSYFDPTHSNTSTRVSSPDLEKGEWTEEKNESIKAAVRERKKKHTSAAVFIKHHVAGIIQRQEFILKLARAMMMFGGPSHRLQAQIQATARVLDIELSCMYLPDVFLVSFDDLGTGTSSIKLIRQGSALDIGKLQETNKVYWKTTHDEISVKEASEALDKLMLEPPFYSIPWIIFFGGMASASICSVGFNGSLIDSLVSFPLGAFVVLIQLIAARNELYSNIFELTMTTLMSFICGVLSASHVFCFPAIVSSSIVLILPGFIVLIGSLELASRQIVAGAVRMGFSIIYSLFFGFGLSLGAQIYQRMTHTHIIGIEDYTCMESHREDIWYRNTPSMYWAFLTVPMFSLFLSLRNMAPWNRKEIIPIVLISCIGWATNHFVATVFVNQLDISAAVGGFAVGFIANIYGRIFRGNAFVVMITGILFQLPSGLSNNGLLHYASESSQGYSESYISGFQVALQLISVAIGSTVGLSISLVLVNPILSRRRRSWVFSL